MKQTCINASPVVNRHGHVLPATTVASYLYFTLRLRQVTPLCRSHLARPRGWVLASIRDCLIPYQPVHVLNFLTISYESQSMSNDSPEVYECDGCGACCCTYPIFASSDDAVRRASNREREPEAGGPSRDPAMGLSPVSAPIPRDLLLPGSRLPVLDLPDASAGLPRVRRGE